MNKALANILFKIPVIRNYAQSVAKQQGLLVRSYSAAKYNRLVADWVSEYGSINRAIRDGHVTLLDRARSLWRNNDYVRALRHRIITNVVGSEGFTLQNHAMLPDGSDNEKVNDLIEEKWYEWCKRENCTPSGQLSFLELSWLMIQQKYRDGNVLLKKVYGDVNKFGFAVEPLEIDLLDTTLNKPLSNGNVIVLGIEFNQWRRPVNYYFRSSRMETELTQSYYGAFKGSEPVRAEDIIHHYDRDHSNQFLGVTHLAQAMLTFHQMNGYDEAAIINARAGASKMGFLQTRDGIAPQYEGDDTDSDGNTITNFSFGEIERLPDGLEFQGWDPKYPDNQYAGFKKNILQRLAAGLGLAYANWVGDLEAVNFSSMRSGLLDERDIWKLQQASFREGVLIPIFNEWLKWAMLNKQVKIPYTQYDEINKPEFIGRRWDWVDPRADVEAEVMAMENHLSTLTDSLAKRGIDLREFAAKRKKELKVLKEIVELEKEISVVKNPAPEPVPQNDDSEDNDKNKPDDKKEPVKPSNGNGKVYVEHFLKG